MRLTENGKCPVDLVKPLTYKRDGIYYCTRCSRTFDIDTGEWRQNSAWIKPYTLQGSAAVVASRDTPEHTHEFLEIKDNESFNCITCGLGINARDYLAEHEL